MWKSGREGASESDLSGYLFFWLFFFRCPLFEYVMLNTWYTSTSLRSRAVLCFVSRGNSTFLGTCLSYIITPGLNFRARSPLPISSIYNSSGRVSTNLIKSITTNKTPTHPVPALACSLTPMPLPVLSAFRPLPISSSSNSSNSSNLPNSSNSRLPSLTPRLHCMPSTTPMSTTGSASSRTVPIRSRLC